MLADVADALESGEPMERVAALERLYHVSYARRAPRVSGDAGRLRDAVLKAIRDLHGLFGDEAPGIESNAWVSLVRIGDRSDAVADALIEQIDLPVVDEESALIVHAAASYLGYFGRREGRCDAGAGGAWLGGCARRVGVGSVDGRGACGDRCPGQGGFSDARGSRPLPALLVCVRLVWPGVDGRPDLAGRRAGRGERLRSLWCCGLGGTALV